MGGFDFFLNLPSMYKNGKLMSIRLVLPILSTPPGKASELV